MSVLFSPGVWAGAISLVSGVLTATGHGPAAAIINDPNTAQAASTLFTALSGLFAGFLPAPGHKG